MAKMFNFKNMQAFVRGCLEPHVVALSTNLKAFQTHVHDTFEVLYQKLREKFAEHDKRFIAVGTVVIWPSKVDPSNMDKYLECDGRRIPITDEYAKLREICGEYTPNYNEYFVRCGNQEKVNTTASDTIKLHNHGFSNKVPAATLSGSISGNTNATNVNWTLTDYHLGITPSSSPVDPWPGQPHNPAPVVGAVWGEGVYSSNSWAVQDFTKHSVTTPMPKLSVSGSTTVTYNGATLSGGVANTGSSETAPKHIYARYLIRALP